MNRLRPRASAVLATLLFLIAFILVGFSYAPAEELPDVVTTKLPLTGAVELRDQRSRSGAPVPIVWTLDWNGQTILEGDLEFDVEDNGQLVGRFRIPDMVLSPGKNAFHSMLPPLSVFKSSIPIMLRPRFVTAKQTFEMSEQASAYPAAMCNGSTSESFPAPRVWRRKRRRGYSKASVSSDFFLLPTSATVRRPSRSTCTRPNCQMSR